MGVDGVNGRTRTAPLRPAVGGTVLLTFIAAFAAPHLGLPAPSVREESIQHLSRLARSDPSFKVRASAARRLGDLSERGAKNHPTVLLALSEALSDKDPIVRAVAAHALAAHGSPSMLAHLDRVRDRDTSELVRSAASKAAETIRATHREAPDRAEKTRRHVHRVELGRVLFAPGAPVSPRSRPDTSPDLLEAIRSTVDDLLEPHRPAIFPREEAEVRLDLTVYRIEERNRARSRSISYEARVLLIQLPGSNLRHASNAKATTRTSNRSEREIRAIERDLALKATTRAVTEALAMLEKR